MGWADRQTQQENSDRVSREHADELRVQEGRALDEIGPKFFAKVKSYVDGEVKKLNAAQRNPSEGMFLLADTSFTHEADIQSKIPSFDLYNQHGRCLHLYVKYSHAQRAILWKIGSREESYKVHKDGYVIRRDGQSKNEEEVGDELLSIARNAEPAAGSVFI